MRRHPVTSNPATPSPGPLARAPTGIITRSANAALCRVLNALRDGWFLEKRLRAVARMIVEEAHRQRLDADQMLLALKVEWPKLLDSWRVPGEADVEMVADRLVSLCRVEFYSVSGRGLR